jgi:hypothetical protein
MKSIFITALVLCSGAAFGQTVNETNSLYKTFDASLIQGSVSGFLIKETTVDNPVLQSTQRDTAPTQGKLTVGYATDKTTAPQSLKKEEPKK